MRLILCILATLALACTHLEHEERTFEGGKLTWEWKTEGSTFMGVKSVEYLIDEKSERATLSGKGISDNAREVAMRGIDKSPELAGAIIRAFRPGGALDGALLELTASDPELAASILEAIGDE